MDSKDMSKVANEKTARAFHARLSKRLSGFEPQHGQREHVTRRPIVY